MIFPIFCQFIFNSINFLIINNSIHNRQIFFLKNRKILQKCLCKTVFRNNNQPRCIHIKPIIKSWHSHFAIFFQKMIHNPICQSKINLFLCRMCQQKRLLIHNQNIFILKHNIKWQFNRLNISPFLLLHNLQISMRRQFFRKPNLLPIQKNFHISQTSPRIILHFSQILGNFHSLMFLLNPKFFQYLCTSFFITSNFFCFQNRQNFSTNKFILQKPNFS